MWRFPGRISIETFRSKDMLRPVLCGSQRSTKVTMLKALECRFFTFPYFVMCYVFIILIGPSYSRTSAKSGSGRIRYLSFPARKTLGSKDLIEGQNQLGPAFRMARSQRSFNFIYGEFLAIVWFDFTFRNVVFDVFSQFWIFTVRNDIIYRRNGQDILT